MSVLTCEVWSANNQTYIGTLTQAMNVEFVDEFNGPGLGSVTVPLDSDDAALLLKDRVIRVKYEGTTRFSWFVETRERVIADSGNRYTLQVAGRGLIAWLEDAVVYPQGGLADFNSPDRPFNFASGDGSWRSSGNYQNAQALLWKNDTTGRKNLPVRWKDRDAAWIWRTNPANAVARGTVNWFYRDFTLTEPKRVRFYASCDNSMEVFLDGQRIMSSSDFDQEAASFTQMARFTIRLGIGTHTLAAKVRNDKPWTRYDLEVSKDSDEVSCSGHGLANGTQVKVIDKHKAAPLSIGTTYYLRKQDDNVFKLATTNSNDTIVNITEDGRVDLQLVADNTAGFILTGLEVNNNGKETSTVVVRTNTSWQVSSTEPYWRPAIILRSLIEEASARGVYRIPQIGFDFNNAAPTSGSWSTEADLTVKVGSDLLTVLDDMVDLGIDFWLHPVDLTLKAWESRGTDQSATVMFDTGDNLIRYSTMTERPIKTVALVRVKNGWLAAANGDLLDLSGRREAFLEYGNMTSEDKAKAQANRVLSRSGRAQVSAGGVEVAITGSTRPYLDFNVGDTVAIVGPSATGTPGRARVLSIALKDEGGRLNFQPELEVLSYD